MDSSVKRAGIAVGACASLLFVGTAFVLDGYSSARHALAPGSIGPVEAAATTESAAPSIVYVRPAATPQVINVTQTASPGPVPVIRQVVPGSGENEVEGGDGD